MSIAQKNGNEPSPAQELENLVEDVAGYDCAYEQAKDKREAAEKALELAKAEEEFEANKLRAILAAVRTKSASDARVYDQHLRNCLGKMKTTRDGTWSNKTRRYEQTPLPGVTKWSELARTGAADAQIISNLKNGFDSYSGVKSGLYQLKGLQFKSILGTDDMGREKGATILDPKRLVAAIRRVMKIGNPKPKAPPPAKKPEPKKPAAAAAKKAPETKAAAKRTAPATVTTSKTSKVKASPAPPPVKLTNVRYIEDDQRPEQTYARKMQKKAAAVIDAGEPATPDQPGFVSTLDWGDFINSVRELTAGKIELHRGPVDPKLWAFFEKQHKCGNKPLEAISLWREKLKLDQQFGVEVPPVSEPHPSPTLQLTPGMISVGKLDPALFDSGTGIPDQPPHQKLSWEQWAHGVRTCQDARSCKDWPQTSSNIPALRQPLVDREDKAVRAAYLAGRKPAAAARELAQMFAKRASRADRSRSTLSDAVSEGEEKSLRGQKVGAA